MKHFLLTLIYISVLANFAVAQKLSKSRRTSYYSYIYKISNAEAKLFYLENKLPKNERLFYAKIDSFPTDSSYRRELPIGYYLFAYALAGKLEYELETVDNLDLKILNNKSDLSLILYDGAGKLVEDAQIHLKNRKIPFDKKSNTYRLAKTNQKGLLAIDYQGFTSYHQINKQYKNSRFKRIKNFVIYNPPVKYVLYPFFWVKWRVRDVVRTIKYGRPEGFIRTIGSIFDPYLRERNYQDKYRSYVVFNKPMYLPKDTVKCKALILSKKGKPIEQELEVWLSGNNLKNRKLFNVKPYQSGNYNFEFYLHDSLGLKLDQHYYLSFYEKDGYYQYNSKELCSEDFRYEDYELKENKYTFRHDKSKAESRDDEVYFTGEPMPLFLHGKDANDMNLLDARVQLTVLARNPKFNIDKVFVKDTLWTYQQKLDAIGETKIIVPDSILPPISVDLYVLAEFYNASNERQTKDLTILYEHQAERARLRLAKDSIYAEYLVNGKSQNIEAELVGEVENDKTEFEKEIFRKKIQLPYREKLNPYLTDYQLFIKKGKEKLRDGVYLQEYKNSLQCLSKRDKDSVQIMIENPYHIPFWYSIYRKNQVLKKGMATELNYQFKNTTLEKYFVSIQYVWANQVQELDYEIPLFTRNLEILVNQPRMVEPGQTADIEIEVKDYTQKPAENVDLTAYAFTKKFPNPNIPTVPNFEKRRKNRKIINKFSEDYEVEKERELPLNFDFWNAGMRLDSIEYFKFLFPQNGLYVQSQIAKDSLTQFSPFVVRKGQIEPVQIIYVDEVPVYFRANNAWPRYAFPIEPGLRNIKLRTAHYLIKLDNMSFQKGQKTLLSVRADSLNPKITLAPQKNAWQSNEITLLNNYMMPIRQSFDNQWLTIKQGNNLQLLSSSFLQGYQYRNSLYRMYKPGEGNIFYSLAGPFRPLFPVEFENISNFKIKADFESGFEYEFKPELVKMRTILASNLIDKSFFRTDYSDNLDDNVLTVKELDSIYQAYTRQREMYEQVFDNPKLTTENNGVLQFSYIQTEKRPKNLRYVLILQPGVSDFLRIYPAGTRQIEQLPKNNYRLIFLLEDGYYFTKDSLDIQVNGINYYRIEEIENLIQKPDSFSLKALKLIKIRTYTPEKHLLEIKKEYNEQTQVVFPSNFNRRIYGQLRDPATGEVMPGVSVFIKGSTIGTITDANGFYYLRVPPNATLVFQSVGYSSNEVKVNNVDRIDILMAQDVQTLSEVVVTGYAMQERRDVTGSISVVSATNPGSLQGKLAGVVMGGKPGDSPVVLIRGISSLNLNSRPLIVIDGVPFEGDEKDLEQFTIEKIESLTGEKATQLYGSRGVNGVIIVKTNRALVQKNQALAESGIEASAVENSLRRNFSDYAYWQPKLRTDKQGKARFRVTFPDDITNWRTVVLATDARKRSGQTQGEIKAFKSLSANLAVPRFLVQGDSTQVIGKALNYGSDTLAVQTAFIVNDREQSTHNQRLITSSIDSLWVKAESQDSLEIKYFLRKQDGYTDGEIRKIPIYPQGSEQTEGNFLVLDKDTSFSLRFSDKMGQVKLYAQADVMDVMLSEINVIRNYRYLCNEQVASKILALLAEKQIKEYMGQKFKDEKDIYFLLNKLIRNQKSDGAWGWWENTETSPWVSLHVAKAFIKAQKAGFEVKFYQQKLIDYLVYQVEKMNHSEKLQSLELLSDWLIKVDYEKYILEMEKNPKLNLHQKLALWLIRQKQGLSFPMDSLLKYRKMTLFGNQYWGEYQYDWFDNSIQSTLLAYKILKLKGNHENDLRKMRNYFFEVRKNACWRNTYESAQIIETILPDLLAGKKELENPSLQISGAINQKIDKFPFEAQLSHNQSITIQKSGSFPVYFTTYQQYWNENPKKVEKDFVVNTYFDTKTNQLKAGKPVKLVIEVEVKKSAEYLMLEVPIPAGCSYESKKQVYHWGNAQHREYEREKTNFYFTSLPQGKYTYTIELLPRYSGKYTLNPAKIEQMYFPTFFGRNEKKRVEIR